jgi:two-component system sensor kinase FixL
MAGKSKTERARKTVGALQPERQLELFCLLMDSLPAYMSYIDGELRYVWVNRRYEEWCGRPREQIIGQHVGEVLGAAAVEERMPHFRQVLAGERVHYETSLTAPDGTIRHFDATYVPKFGPKGDVPGFFALVFDATERRQAEEKRRESELLFRRLAENIQEVFWVGDPTGEAVLYVSPAYEKIWGRSAESLYQNPLSWLQAIHPEDRERVRALFTPTNLAEGRFDVEYRILRPDGSIRWIHDRGFPVRDETGRVQCIAGLAEDVSRIKQAADRERQLLADLAHMGRLTTMGEMASGLAHELNQPLSAIINYIDASVRLLRAQGQTPANVLEAMEAAAAEADRAGKIIHRMRHFLHRTEPRQTAVDLNELVQEALALAGRDVRLSSTHLQVDLASDLPAVLADRIQIEQVVLNLVRNALEAMHDTPLEERILTVRTRSMNNCQAEITVSDTGCGLSPGTQNRLFQPFFTTKADGMGMGLAISRTILTAHGGRLEATPHAVRGATFTLTLPLAEKGRVS